MTSSTVSCPFSDINKCVNASNTQIPIFSSQFCNESFPNSTAQLVSQEQQNNSTMWQQSLVNLSAVVSDLSVNPIDFSQLVAQSSQLQSSITTYQPQMYSGIQMVLFILHRLKTTLIQLKSVSTRLLDSSCWWDSWVSYLSAVFTALEILNADTSSILYGFSLLSWQLSSLLFQE